MTSASPSRPEPEATTASAEHGERPAATRGGSSATIGRGQYVSRNFPDYVPLGRKRKPPKRSRRQPVPITDAEVPDLIERAVLTHVTFRRAKDGELIETPIDRNARIDFDAAAPVREPVSYRGQWSKPGYQAMVTTGQMVSYESRKEQAHLLMADRDPHLAFVLPQPFRIHWRNPAPTTGPPPPDTARTPSTPSTPSSTTSTPSAPVTPSTGTAGSAGGGTARRHTPDFIFKHHDGSIRVVDVKGSAAANKPGNRYIFGVTAKACALLGFHYTIAADINPIVLANLRFLGGYRFGVPYADVLAPILLDCATEPMPLQKLIQAASLAADAHPLRVRGVTFYLIWSGLLHVNLKRPLSESVAVTSTSELSEVSDLFNA